MPPVLRAALAALAVSMTATAALAADAFPVAIEHVYGTTVIEQKPERVLTISWMSQDTVLALGIVPVAIPYQSWGGDENGYLPWVADKLAELDKGMPTQIDFSGGIPFETILEAAPDVILARYSGLTDEDYERLSAIAPTVAFVEQPWQGEWRDVTRTVAKALGESERGEQLVAETEALIAAARDTHPEFAGKSFVFVTLRDGSDGIGVYVRTDPRVQLVEDLGFTLAPGAAALPLDQGYNLSVSFEQLDTLDADLLVGWYGEEADVLYYQTHPLLSRFRPIVEGRHVAILDRSFVMATSAPSPLAIPWSLQRLVPLLEDATD
jgi:iron complex transport system substrate-binding protein